MSVAVIFCLALLPSFIMAAPRLQSYHGDGHQVSVSGISSGACMATQFHVVYSSRVMGAGVIAGAPYMCAGDTVAGALFCDSSPSQVNVALLESTAYAAALVGNIDSLSNLGHSRVYIYDGKRDSVVLPASGINVERFYEHYMSSSNIKTVFNVDSEHGMPTDNYGDSCTTLNKQDYMINCNYSAAYDLLNHIYHGSLQKAKSSDMISSNFHTFDQHEFHSFSFFSLYDFMDTIAYVYVPSSCKSKPGCKVHVAFHGCEMGRNRIGDTYARHAGYNEVAELNGIIIIYPQTVPVSFTNPLGCWDWWGYSSSLYATHSGPQGATVHRMIERVLS